MQNSTPNQIGSTPAARIGGPTTGIAMIVISLFASTLFLGGPSGPGSQTHWWLGILYLFIKTLVFLFFYVWLRGTLPRFRYDQLMKMCWRMLLPLSIANVFVTAILLLIIDNASLMAKNALGVAADLTQLTTMIAFVVAIVAMARWLLAPAKKHRVVLTSTAKMVAEQGGTRHSPMQA